MSAPESGECDSTFVILDFEAKCELLARHSGLHQVVVYWGSEDGVTYWDTEAWSEPEKG